MDSLSIHCTSTKHSMCLYRDVFLPSYIQHCSHIPHTLKMHPGPEGGIGNHGSAEWFFGTRGKLELCVSMCITNPSQVVCISDVDMLWVGDPQRELSEIEANEIYVTRDSLLDNRINSGIIAFRPSDTVFSMLTCALDYSRINNLDDQCSMEATLKTRMLSLGFCNTKTVDGTTQRDHVCFHPTVSQPSEGLSSASKKMSHVANYLSRFGNTH
jgi:hypothetical protein